MTAPSRDVEHVTKRYVSGDARVKRGEFEGDGFENALRQAQDERQMRYDMKSAVRAEDRSINSEDAEDVLGRIQKPAV
jgi:hypothetical protein